MPWRASAAALAVAGGAVAQEAVETFRETLPLAVATVPLRPWAEGVAPVERVEGAVERAAWRLGGDTTAVATLHAEQAAREADGWETALFCVAEGCGGFDFRDALDPLPPPHMRLDLFDYAALTMRRGDAVLSAIASRAAGETWLQTTTIAPPEAPPRLAEEAPAEPAAAPAAPVAGPADPDDIADALDRVGRAVLEGVEFEPGSTAVAPSSAAALDAAAAALAARADGAFVVVGHTDDTGDLALNQRVSAARAEAVVEALAARGVARARLSAAGAGWLAPRASNATEEGRALNRRVEIILR